MGLYTGVINGIIIKLRIAWFYKPGAYMGGGGLIYGVLQYYMIFLYVYFRKSSNMKKC